MAKLGIQFNYNKKREKNIIRSFLTGRLYLMPAQTWGIHFDIHCKGGIC